MISLSLLIHDRDIGGDVGYIEMSFTHRPIS